MKRLVLAATLAAVAAGLPAAALAAEPSKAEPAKKEAEAGGEGNLKIWEWANFLILVGGLGYLVRKHAGPFYAARAAGIGKDLVESERVAKDAAARAAEVDLRLAGLEDEIAALRAESQRESAAEVERYARQTAAEIAKIGANGEQEIRAAQKAARLDLQRFAARLAVTLAEVKVRARMDAGTEGRLLEGFERDLARTARKN
jgi:F-type H+-transporting ATPase subunit b